MLQRFLIVLLVLALCACRRAEHAGDGRIIVKYWEKWTGFEADAMRAVVDDFNASQDRIFVDFSSVSQIDRKLMLAISGGVPPDVAGIWGFNLPVYAGNNALMPLDKFAAQAGIQRDQYIDVYWQMGCYRGHLWGLPTTPASTALVWNKKLFRAAGLDPDRPPRSIAELEEYNERLTKRRSDGRLAACGQLPSETGWHELWGIWFGGTLWDGTNTITANSPQNIAAFQWIESYPKRFGSQDLLAFHEASGNFASPQNPFFTGRVAMILEGPWMYNYIKQYAPDDFEWGVGPFPSADPEHLKNVTVVEMDALAIPAGARHPKEAFEFIRYVNSRKPMEKLCLGQLKFSPLRECSQEFYQKHPDPNIREYVELAKSPNAHFLPQLTTWNMYSNDMNQAFDRIWAGKASAREALDEVQRHEQPVFDGSERKWNRFSAKLMAEWSNQ